MCPAVSQLRQQEDRLMGLVDKMVQGYHSGFAKSIQNYSQILHLFGDAKEQVGDTCRHGAYSCAPDC